MITSTATNQRGKFSIITYGYVIILSLLKVRLHTAIRRVRLVFWRIQSSRHASIVHLKFRFNSIQIFGIEASNEFHKPEPESHRTNRNVQTPL